MEGLNPMHELPNLMNHKSQQVKWIQNSEIPPFDFGICFELQYFNVVFSFIFVLLEIF